jgi:acyl-CoA reductase-like NAD-dependent aldehyde dehydrogenase
MRTVELLIGGKPERARNGATFDRLDPYTGAVASRVAAAAVEDADAAVEAAVAAFPAWSVLGPTERRRRLLKAADILESMIAEFITTGMEETGATPPWYGFNVALGANMLREAAAMTTQIGGEVNPSDVPGNISLALRRPCGVVLGIAPWNAPVILGVRAVAMPLACGNTVVLKASESSPGVHRLIGAALDQAGLGEGVVNVILNAPKDAPVIVERLIAHPAVRRVNFTGSTAVGRTIAQLAARHLKPALLELGGKASMVVLDDAALDDAVAAALFGAFANQGQVCMSTERVVIDHSLADAFAARLAERASTLLAGDPRRQDVVLGTLISADAGERIAALVADAVSKGAKLLCGGRLDGAVMQPTVLDRVTPAMRLYAEESFGPVVVLIRVEGEEEAVRVANDTPYGLVASIFSRDTARALRVAARIQCGNCHINGPTVHDEANMPFGGVKDSGYGRFGAKASIAEFTDLQWVSIQAGPRQLPF